MRNRLLNSLGVFVVFLVSFTGVYSIGESYPGRIAYIGADYNIYTIAQNQTYTLTTDGHQNKVYQWVTWAKDGRLAYFCCDLPSALTLDTAAYVSDDGYQTGRAVWQSRAESVIYAYWSPSTCGSDGCRNLAILHNSLTDRTLAVTLIQDSGTESQTTKIGIGSPFYFHFSPNGDEMIFHRNNDDIEIFSVAENSVTDALTSESIASFQAPTWSPVDNRVLYGIEGGEFTTNLIISNAGTDNILVEGVRGYVSFVWSPNGRYVAYRALNSDGYSNIMVLDAQSGEVIAESANNAVAFWWSPNSERIAYVSLDGTGNVSQGATATLSKRAVVQQDRTLVWSVLEIASEQSRLFGNFYPTYEMGYMMTYFDQFAPSHPIWSPDSRYIVYSQIKDEQPFISVIDIESAGFTTDIANGVFATWSFE
jgi:Tol biopolymer transport system component